MNEQSEEVSGRVAGVGCTGDHKVGRNRDRPRIWLDGKRLKDVGFVGGTEYWCVVAKDAIVCVIGDYDDAVRALLSVSPLEGMTRKRKVTGRSDGKPIIDIVGRDVEAALPGVERVQVTFEPGKITIRSASAETVK